MVLQRGKPVPVWGWANPGTQVEVSFGGQKKEAKADEHGYWKAVLDPMIANREGQVMTVQIGSTAVSCKNVLVGEVWLSAGHSETAADGPDLDTGIYPHHISPGTKGGKPEIRILDFGRGPGASLEPYDDLDPLVQADVHWKVMQEDPPPARMSAVQYFARVVRDELDVPVGILYPVCVGVGQMTWLSRETLEAFPAESGSGNLYQECLAKSEAGFAKNPGPIKSWSDFQKAESEWRVTKNGPWPNGGNLVGLFAYPGVGYNTKIHPLAPFALSGVIFYASQGNDMPERIVAMVKQWRTLFGQDFCFINCTNRRETISQPPLFPSISGTWLATASDTVRRSLKLFGDDKRVAVVEVNDIGNRGSHFAQKAEQGRRLGLAALSLAYGQKQIYTGPQMAETKIEGNKAIVRFEQVGDGLVYEPSIDGISGVYLRGKTGPSRWANVKVLGKDTVEFSHPDIADLEMVSYGENANPHETLFNSGGLPASPFVVNSINGRDPPLPYEILSLQGIEKTSPIRVSLVHVRRSGYVFQLVGKESYDPAMLMKPGQDDEQVKASTALVSVQAYIPAEWKGFEVEALGKKLDTTETTTSGARFATFNAPLGMTWIIVAEAGKAAEFRKINRY